MDTIRAEVRRVRAQQEREMRSQTRVEPYSGRASKQEWFRKPDHERGLKQRQSRMATCWRCGRDGRYAVHSGSKYGRLSHQRCHGCQHPLGSGANTRWRKGNEP